MGRVSESIAGSKGLRRKEALVIAGWKGDNRLVIALDDACVESGMATKSAEVQLGKSVTGRLLRGDVWLPGLFGRRVRVG